jgi:hypothetical protein
MTNEQAMLLAREIDRLLDRRVNGDVPYAYAVNGAVFVRCSSIEFGSIKGTKAMLRRGVRAR